MEEKTMSKAKDLSQGNIGKLLFTLALPAIISQIVNLLYNMVDRIYIGQGVGALALTGLGVCTSVILLVSASASLVAMGGAPRAAIFLGKGDIRQAEKIMGNCTLLLIIVAVILTVIFSIWGRQFLLWFGASSDTIDYAWAYLQIYTLGTIFVQMTLGLNAFITTQGFAKEGMLTVAIGAICNIVLDPIFIFLFKMGVRGAALATILSQCVSMIWTIRFLTGSKTGLKLKAADMKLDIQIIAPCLGLGLAPFIMQSTESILSICFNSSLLKYGGDLAVGSMTILSTVMQFSQLPLVGLAQGAQPILSFNFGAKRMDRVAQTFRLLLTACLIYSCTLWAMVQLFPQLFVGIFTSDAELLAYAPAKLRIYMLISGLFGIQMACQQSFVALGNMKCSVIVALLRKVILLIPLIYIMPCLIADKVQAVILAEPIADFVSVTTCGILFFVTFRKLMKNYRNSKPANT